MQYHGTVVVVPEGETAVLVLGIGPLGLFGTLRPAMEVDELLDMLGGAVQPDVEEVGFVFRSGDAGQGPDLGVAELALGQGIGEQRQLCDAMDAGERFVSELGLGPVPALRLAAVMEEELEILVLMVDAQEGISGAACRLPELDAVLIARRELAGSLRSS